MLLPLSEKYTVLWCSSQILEFWFGSLAGQGPYEVAQIALIVAAFAFYRKRWLVSVAMIVRGLGLFTRIPTVFDGEYLETMTDLVVGIGIALRHDDAAIESTLRWQMGIFYFSCGLWKLNTAFLDPVSSCASVYFVQIADAFNLSSLAPFLFKAAGPATVALESAIGVCLLFAPAIGVFLAVLLHAGIAITPPPNNIAPFGIICIVRCFWLVGDHGEWSASVLASSVVGVAVLLGLTNTFHSTQSVQSKFVSSFDYPAGFYGGLAVVALSASVAAISSTKRKSSSASDMKTKNVILWLFGVGSMTAWCFAPIIFGFLDGGSPNMFSNLRMFAGSNHLFLPTGLLQEWNYDNPNSVFSGGVLRVEESNSTLLRKVHPAELTPLLTDGTKKMLKDLGHPSRFFNPSVAICVGTHIIPEPPILQDRYTLPAMELARSLAATNEPMSLVFSKLPGSRGDEAWRNSEIVDYTTHIVFYPRFPTLHSCSIKYHNGTSTDEKSSVPCDEDTLFYQPYLRAPDTFLNSLGRSFSYWNSQILLEGYADQLPCYGS